VRLASFPTRRRAEALSALPPQGVVAAPIIRRVPDRFAPDRPSTPPGDEALLAEFAAGDAAAFETLYTRHERPMFRFLRRSLGNDAAAQDLMQDVWLAVVRNAAAFEPRARFAAWLYGIARNRLIDHWRTRRDTVSLDEEAANDNDGASAIEQLAAGADCEPQQRALSRAQAMAFMAAVEQLPALQREAFLLHAEAGLTVEEVAQLTGVGRETAKSRLRYAMARLRAAMQGWQ
jgi:RNA polymerase sigma factor (sigma-70 family)